MPFLYFLILFVFSTLSFLNAEELQMRPLISMQEIDGKLEKVSITLRDEFNGEPVVIIAVLKGAFMVVADLVKHLDFPVTIEFIRASSYGMKGKQRGQLTIQEEDALHLEGKNVLLVDDIFDSGATLSTIAQNLNQRGPKKLKTLVLLNKRAPRATDFLPDFSLFEIENHFVIGYGLDYKEHYRELPGIFVVD